MPFKVHEHITDNIRGQNCSRGSSQSWESPWSRRSLGVDQVSIFIAHYTIVVIMKNQEPGTTGLPSGWRVASATTTTFPTMSSRSRLWRRISRTFLRASLEWSGISMCSQEWRPRGQRQFKAAAKDQESSLQIILVNLPKNKCWVCTKLWQNQNKSIKFKCKWWQVKTHINYLHLKDIALRATRVQ